MGDKKEAKRVPKLRFKGFTDDWEQRKLKYYMRVSTEKNKNHIYDKKDVLSVSGEYGVVNQIKFQGRSFAGKDVSNYKVLMKNNIVYTKSPLKNNPYGIIKVNHNKTGIVSTLYAVYIPTLKVYPDFIELYFADNLRLNRYLKPIVNIGAKHDMKIKNNEVINHFVTFPSKNEQKNISQLFKQIEKVISLQQRKLSHLLLIKQFLLQNIFVNVNNGAYPNLRFKDFTNKWEKIKLGGIVEIIGGGTPSTKIPDYWNGDINWYSPQEIGNSIFVNSSNKKITDQGLKHSSAKLMPGNKTILFTSRASIGDMAIMQTDGSTNQGFQSWVVDPNTIDIYFLFSLGKRIKKQALRKASGSTFLEISNSEVKKLDIQITNKDEQQKIGNLLRKLDNIIYLHHKAIKKIINLKQFLLQNMFI